MGSNKTRYLIVRGMLHSSGFGNQVGMLLQHVALAAHTGRVLVLPHIHQPAEHRRAGEPSESLRGPRGTSRRIPEVSGNPEQRLRKLAASSARTVSSEVTSTRAVANQRTPLDLRQGTPKSNVKRLSLLSTAQ